jgi:dTDP-glucose 4,6-dehydratase
MKVLVTGGLGFIGSHIVERILKLTDWDIVCLDNISYSARAYDGVVTDSRVRYVYHDIKAPLDAVDSTLGTDFDYIIHNAAQSHVTRSMQEPVLFFQTNVMGTVHLLEFARRQKNLKRFHYVSTDEVYGPLGEGQELHTEDDRHRPSNPYSASKAGGDDAVYAYAHSMGVPALITRCMNNFGERQHDEKFIPLLVKKILRGEQITLHGSADDAGSRMWTYAGNHADAILHLLLNSDSMSNFEEYNIPGELEYDNYQMLHAVAALLKTAPRVNYAWEPNPPDRPGHDHKYGLSGDKLYARGWKPPMGFYDSFGRTIKWLEANQ